MTPQQRTTLNALVPPFGTNWLICLYLIYACLGIVGHDPWKSADAINLVIANTFASESMAAAGADRFVVPTMAGEPWLANPPLYHWLAAVAGNSLDAWLPWHDAARLTSAVFTLIGLLFIGLAARGFHGRDASRVAPLLAVGALGLIVPAHDAQPALVGFAACAGTLAALAWWPLYPRRCAIALSTAIGVGFLGTGLESLILNFGIVVSALAFRDWRGVSRDSWLLALALGTVLIVAWPVALYTVSPEFFGVWIDGEIERLTDAPTFGLRRFELLLWGTWPVLPLAGWTLWLNRRQLLLGRHLIVMTASVAALYLYFLADDANEGIPVVIATLAIMGSAEVGRLRRGAANAFDWFGCITLTLFMGLIWLAGISILTGHPARIAKNFTKFTPEFDPQLSWIVLSVALLATLHWLVVLFATPRTPWRAPARWASGIVSIWVLIVCLLMPWVDHEKSYRTVADRLQSYLRNHPGCIDQIGLGSAQRASLAYFTNLHLTSAADSNQCRYRLLETTPGPAPSLDGWQWIADFSRPGDRKERWRLYQRVDTAS